MVDIHATPAWRAEVICDFARSELFARTFEEGMELVEKTAAYLDGAGRQEAKVLSRKGALAYAATSMRLTTRLMQLASWLLVQRAVREGDMAPDEACDERYRIGGDPPAAPEAGEGRPQDLPAGLLALAERSERLHDRVRHLDRRMYVDAATTETPHPVLSQHDRLKTAFGG